MVLLIIYTYRIHIIVVSNFNEKISLYSLGLVSNSLDLRISFYVVFALALENLENLPLFPE